MAAVENSFTRACELFSDAKRLMQGFDKPLKVPVFIDVLGLVPAGGFLVGWLELQQLAGAALDLIHLPQPPCE
jgi:hypothetical protein